MPTFLRVLILLCLWCVAPHAVAVDLLFRGDGRDPAEIFRDGFTGPGTNRNVLGQISGQSCNIGVGAARSAYIASTASEDVARTHAGRIYAQRGFVYRIVPDADAPDGTAAFDAMAGLGDLRDRQDWLGLDMRTNTAVARLIQHPLTPHQHFAERIPPERIQSADVYERDPDSGEWVYRERVANPHFVQPQRTGTRSRFTNAMIASLEPIAVIVYVTYGNMTNALAACMSDCSRSARSVGPASAAEGQCHVEDVFMPGNRWQQVLDIILD